MAAQYDNLWTRHSVAATEFSARELEVLIEIATVVSAASSISDINSSFAALVADVIEWDGILVTTSNADGRTFTIRLREEATLPGRAVGGTVVIDGTLHGETVKTRETQYFTADDGQTAELALKIPGLRDLLLAGFRSFLSTPLFSQGEIVGMISMRSYEPHAFSDHDRTLFERIAAFVGPTIGRFDAYEALRRDDIRNKSLLKIGQLLLGAHDIGDVLEQFAEELRAVMEVDRLVISIAQSDGAALVDRYRHGVRVPNWDENIFIPMDALEPNGVDVTSHGYILPHGAMRDADRATSPGFYANYQAGLRAAMLAGLKSEGRLVGVINVKSVNERAYGVAELEYFEQVADHVAASIQRTLAHESEIEMDRIEEDRILARQNERRVVDVLRAKERLVSSASQELRTPLSGIMAFVDLLVRNRRGNLDEKQIRYLSIVRHNAEELSGQVDTLISHAERKSGQLHVSAGGFETATTVQGADTAPVPKPGEREQSANVESYDALE